MTRPENMRWLCAFCGSRVGSESDFITAAEAMGRSLVTNGCGLVYGGGCGGMMGAIADAVLDAGGEVIGVVPAGLFGDEHVHDGLSQLKEVQSMAERKAVMTELSDAFVTLPGGLGTLDELFEMWAYAQIGLQSHPLGLLNTLGYYDHLLAFLDNTVANGYVEDPYRQLLIVDDQPDQLVRRLLR